VKADIRFTLLFPVSTRFCLLLNAAFARADAPVDVAFEAQTSSSKLYRMPSEEHNFCKPADMN
jgi:hypothetical protein